MDQIEEAAVMAPEPEVVAVNRIHSIALLDTGQTIPVASWLDDEDDACDADDAVRCVCGNDLVGWYAVDLSHFGPPTLH